MACKLICTPCFQLGIRVARRKQVSYPGGDIAYNTPTDADREAFFTDLTAASIRRATRYSKFPQRSGRHANTGQCASIGATDSPEPRPAGGEAVERVRMTLHRKGRLT